MAHIAFSLGNFMLGAWSRPESLADFFTMETSSAQRLTLWFEGKTQPALVRSCFRRQHGTGQETNCVRGKDGSAFGGWGSFQWTAGVQALSWLLVRGAAWQHLDDHAAASSHPTIAGVRGSLAASLDYALTKHPLWLGEMLGVDVHGTPLACRLVTRNNSHTKRNGPVTLGLRHSFLRQTELQVFLDNQLLTSATSLRTLGEQLGRDRKETLPSAQPHTKRKTESGLPSDDPTLTIFLREAQAMLQETPVFQPKPYRRMVRRLMDQSCFRSFCREPVSLVSEHDLGLPAGARLGGPMDGRAAARFFAEPSPFRVALPVSAAGALAIFQHLQSHQGNTLQIDRGFPHTLDLRQRIEAGDFENPPDAMVLGSIPAASFLSRRKDCGYEPLMLMPSGSQQLLGAKNARGSLAEGHYLYLKDQPSTSMQFFESLVDQQRVMRRTVETEHAEPDEAMAALLSGDPALRSIMFFPYGQLALRTGRCTLLRHAKADDQDSALILFVRRDRFASPREYRLLATAVRNAWATLLSNPALLRKALAGVLQDPDFRTGLGCFSGSHPAIAASLRGPTALGRVGEIFPERECAGSEPEGDDPFLVSYLMNTTVHSP